MSLIRKGDTVQIISGNDSKYSVEECRGTVTEVMPKKDLLLVEGMNLRKKHERVRPTEGGGQEGGIIEKEMPIHISNVMFVDPETDKPVRLGTKVKDDGTKVRVTKGRNASGAEV